MDFMAQQIDLSKKACFKCLVVCIATSVVKAQNFVQYLIDER